MDMILLGYLETLLLIIVVAYLIWVASQESNSNNSKHKS